MSVLKYFKNILRSPPIRRQALSVIFFFKFATRSLKKRGPVAPPRATGGACRPPSGDRGNPPYIRSNPPFPPHLSPKIPPKIQKKKRGVRRREAAKTYRIQHL